MIKELIVKFCLWVLLKLTGKNFVPEAPAPPPPPPPPPHNIPDWVIEKWDYETLMGFESLYAPNNDVAVFRVPIELVKVPVFFAEPGKGSITPVTAPDGTPTFKYIFESRGEKLITIQQGEIFLGFRKNIPATIKVQSKAYSDGKPMTELCEIVAGTVFPGQTDMIGYIKDGQWHDVE